MKPLKNPLSNLKKKLDNNNILIETVHNTIEICLGVVTEHNHNHDDEACRLVKEFKNTTKGYSGLKEVRIKQWWYLEGNR